MVFLLLGYMWLYVHRPFEIWPWLGNLYIERVYILTIAVIWLLLYKKSFFWNINLVGVVFVTAAILVSDFMTNTTGETNRVVEEWSKIIFYAILLVASIRNEFELKILLTGFAVIFFVYMLHSYYEFKFCGRYEYRMGIIRMIGIGNTMSDANSFGASIVFYLPVLVPLWGVLRGIFAIPVRLFVIISFGLAVVCITYTGSRAAFVGLLAYAILAVAFSKNRWKIMAVACVLLPIVWMNMGERLQNRYLTLIDSSRGPANAQVSAEGRMKGFLAGMELFTQSPLYGVGPGHVQDFLKFQTHNFIGQVAGELGGLGLFAYFSLCCCITINYVYSRFYWKILTARNPNADSYLFQVSQAIFIALILLLLMGIGGHNAYRYTWVWFAVFQSMAVVSLKKTADDYIRETHNEKLDLTQESWVPSSHCVIDRPVPV